MKAMRTIIVFTLLIATGTARADGENVLAGPLVGFRLGGTGSRFLLGIEGGVGALAERANLGIEYRDGKGFGYIELDPWLLVGGSFGVGVDTEGEVHPVIGVWEGAPVIKQAFDDCGDRSAHFGATIAVGYRYTGVHEVYLTAKAGVGRPATGLCN